MRADFADVLQRVQDGNDSGRSLRDRAMTALAGLEGYDWAGVYRMEGGKLLLDAYVGEETDHTEIDIGVGVCGAAVAEDKNQVVQDVLDLSNYLACSVATRSEIVVLIRDPERKVLGQIDVDSHSVARFGTEDEKFLEALASVLANRWS